MDVSVEKKELENKLRLIKSILPSRGTQPIYTQCLLTCTEEEGLTLRATNEVTCQEMCGMCAASVTEPGEVLISPDFVLKCLRTFVSDYVSISCKTEKVKIRSGDRVFVIPSLPVDKYPPKKTQNMDWVVLPVDYQSVINYCRHAIGDISDLTIQGKQGLVEGGATDGFRLAYIQFKSDPECPDFNIHLPKYSLDSIKRGTTLSVSDEYIRFSDMDTVQTLRQIKNNTDTVQTLRQIKKTMNYSKIIKGIAEPEHRVATDRDVLLAAAKALDVLSNLDTCIRIRANEITVFSGESYETIGGDGGDHEEVIGINLTYLAQALSAMPDGEVSIGYTGRMDPVVLKSCLDSTTKHAKQIIMPMRFGT